MRFLFFFVHPLNPRVIQNMDKPVCKNCKFFKQDPNFNDLGFAKCIQFGTKSLITGKIMYEDIQPARYNLCGINGTYYEPNIIS
jgi:hypothetical protein